MKWALQPLSVSDCSRIAPVFSPQTMHIFWDLQVFWKTRLLAGCIFTANSTTGSRPNSVMNYARVPQMQLHSNIPISGKVYQQWLCPVRIQGSWTFAGNSKNSSWFAWCLVKSHGPLPFGFRADGKVTFSQRLCESLLLWNESIITERRDRRYIP